MEPGDDRIEIVARTMHLDAFEVVLSNRERGVTPATSRPYAIPVVLNLVVSAETAGTALYVFARGGAHREAAFQHTLQSPACSSCSPNS